jgi:hypothetical protein
MSTLGNTGYQKLSEQLDAERAYRDHLFFTTKSQRSFVVKNDALSIDQQFTTSLMLTPDTMKLKEGQVVNGWRNIFRQGNWIFSPESNSFMQTELVTIQGQLPTDQATKALYNSIFKEFYPIADYQIVVECTITEISYPCIVGVVFNNARWISGVPDRFHQHRFVGAFGNNGSLYGVLAESKNSTDKSATLEWPALQILSKPDQFMRAETKLSAATPLTLTFTITTKPTQASCVVQTKTQNTL